MALDHIEGGVGGWLEFASATSIAGYGVGACTGTTPSVSGGALIATARMVPTSAGGPGLPDNWRADISYYAAASSSGGNTLHTLSVTNPYPSPLDGIEDQYPTKPRNTYGHKLWQIRFRTSTYDAGSATYSDDGEIHIEVGGVSILSLTGLFINRLPTSGQWCGFLAIFGDAGWVWTTNQNEFVTTSGSDGVPSSLNLLSSTTFDSGTLDGWSAWDANNTGTAGSLDYWFHSNSGRGGTRGISVFSTDASSPYVPAGGPGSRSLRTGVYRAEVANFPVVDAGDDEVPVDESTPCCCDCPGSETSGGGGDTGENPDPVGVLPPWTRSCESGGVVDAVADLADGESWL